LAPWASYLREMLQLNKRNPLPLPWEMNEEEELAELEAIEDEEARTNALAAYQTNAQYLRRAEETLGLEFDEEMSATERWQEFLNKIPQADFQSQQMLSALRFDAKSGRWYTADIGQLQNPEYL
jgi:hypothetical protein